VVQGQTARGELGEGPKPARDLTSHKTKLRSSCCLWRFLGACVGTGFLTMSCCLSVLITMPVISYVIEVVHIIICHLSFSLSPMHVNPERDQWNEEGTNNDEGEEEAC
jgi:hypothetical protein